MAEVKEKDKNMEELRAELLAQIKEEAMAEVKEEAKNILEEAKAQADEIIAAAGSAGGEDTAKPKKVKGETKAQIEKANELVKIKLFKDKGKYFDDVTVIINGQSYLIKRGVEVEVPRKVAQVIADSERQRGYAADIIDGFIEEGKQADNALR